MKKMIVLSMLFLLFVSVANAEEVNEVLAEGKGTNERSAVEDAFRNAIEQSIGVYVDSETRMENDKIIKDNILTASKGYIEKYMLLSIENQDGLTTVEIKAIVKMQDVRNKLETLNIATLDVQETKNIYARLSTKKARMEDAEKILRKEFEDFYSTESILDMLDIQLISYKIHEDKATRDNMVPIEINFATSINIHNYNEKIKMLEQVIKNFAVSASKEFEVWIDDNEPTFAEDKSYDDYIDRIRSMPDKNHPYLGIVTIKNNRYILTHYKFPIEWQSIYPWKGHSYREHDILDRILLVITLKSNNSILLQKKLNGRDFPPFSSYFLSGVLSCSWYSGILMIDHPSTEKAREHNICPFVESGTYSHVGLVSSGTYETNIKVDLLYDLQSIELKLEKRGW